MAARWRDDPQSRDRGEHDRTPGWSTVRVAQARTLGGVIVPIAVGLIRAQAGHIVVGLRRDDEEPILLPSRAPLDLSVGCQDAFARVWRGGQ